MLIALAAGTPAVAAPAWLAPVDLSDTVGGVDGQRIAVNARGDAVAVWRQLGIENSTVQMSRRAAGQPWQPPEFDGGGMFDASPPLLAVDGNGDALTVWSRFNGRQYVIEGVEVAANGATQGFTLSTVTFEFRDDAQGPQVAVNARGDAVVVWVHFDGADWIVQSAARPAGGAWEAPVDLSASGQDAGFAQVGVDANGDATAVWERADATNANAVVQSARRPAGGAWELPVDLSVAGQDAHRPALAVDPRGSVVAVWQRSDAADTVVQSARRPAGGAWRAPVDLSTAGQDASFAEVALSAHGRAVAVWQRFDGTSYAVQSATRVPGGGWEAPVTLSAESPQRIVPLVGLDARGGAVALWGLSEAANSSEQLVQSALRAAGGAWEAPVTVAGGALSPDLGVDAHGNAVAVWTHINGSGGIVQAAAYDAAGPLLEALSVPARGVVGQPLSFSVSPTDAWSALRATTWTFGDGATATGTSVMHTYRRPGRFSVRVTASDALGNTSDAQRRITVVCPRRHVTRRIRGHRRRACHESARPGQS